MRLCVRNGDLLELRVEVIVNAWNRNFVPWWLLLPQGVAASIKRRAGSQPFRELWRHGPIPLGGAVLTSAGRLPFRGVIHVAGINLIWRSSEFSVRRSVRSAMEIVREKDFQSVGFPLIGAGSGGGLPEQVMAFMTDELSTLTFSGDVHIVRFQV